MTKNKSQIIFDKCNPKEAVTRCPNGRSPVRKLLDTYAKSAVNLYGVISIEEFVEIFNNQNIEQTTVGEVFTLLLPLVLKNKWYCFYNDFIVHYWAIDDFDYAEYWINEQSDKPRFIPERSEFLRYQDQYYECEAQMSYWGKLLEFIFNELPDKAEIIFFFEELKENAKFNMNNISEISNLLDKYGIEFNSDKQFQLFFDMLMEANNNTRFWSNNGYTPTEMFKIMEKRRQRSGSPEMIMQKRVKIGRNDPCPCGSGKKYKQCCRLTEESKTAQLSQNECILFYETWYGLMGFINKKSKIINATIKPVYPNQVSDEQIFKVREFLWNNPKLINDYLDSAVLSDEKMELLKSWRDYHIKGMFFIADYTPEFAVVIGTDEQKCDRLYGIKGISRSLADVMQRELPIQFETVLLPFKEKIIYDSFINYMPISFAEGAKNYFQETYENALENGIITVLGDI